MHTCIPCKIEKSLDSSLSFKAFNLNVQSPYVTRGIECVKTFPFSSIDRMYLCWLGIVLQTLYQRIPLWIHFKIIMLFHCTKLVGPFSVVLTFLLHAHTIIFQIKMNADVEIFLSNYFLHSYSGNTLKNALTAQGRTKNRLGWKNSTHFISFIKTIYPKIHATLQILRWILSHRTHFPGMGHCTEKRASSSIVSYCV